MMDVTKCAIQEALIDLGRAFDGFFKKRVKYPKPKKKGLHDSFTMSSGTFAVDGDRIRIPRLGYVRMSEACRFDGKSLSATVSRTADQWFVSLSVEIDDQALTDKPHRSVGVDLGVTTFASLSDGTKVAGPKAHSRLLAKQARLNRQLSRKNQGSKNRHKAKMKLARLHARIANVRKDSIHKLTTELASNYEVICIEDVNVSGIVKNHNLARVVSDMGFFEFRRQLGYKCERNGSTLVAIDRWYPSSKTCSSCGEVIGSLPLRVRTWTCEGCGAEHDRDINAAINIERVGLASIPSPTASSAGSNDRGDGGSGQSLDFGSATGETTIVEAVSEPQTSNSKFV
ncbi:RNA-guided endonuclease InsQ/TnpB family protein [Ferrimicrobium sp.]|uniref:RNA-guided endonuclease InsQ/TnpB family protein n=1 Tax=Ferrimicrobium sp. TaxID=2926050 RepID=UPI00345D5E59